MNAVLADEISYPILALDVGNKLVGLAIKSEVGVPALPVGSFKREQRIAEKQIIAEINERGVKTLIAGLPLDERGSATEQSRLTVKFCQRVIKRVTIGQFFYVDEYGSSSQSKAELSCLGKNEKLLKGVGAIDATAALVILNGFLDGSQRAFTPEQIENQGQQE